MIETITAVNHAVNQFIWGVPAMVCIIGVGLLLSVRTGFLQIRKFPYAIKTTIGRMFRKKDASDGAMTPFQAVCTALAGTVGTGNIAGVAVQLQKKDPEKYPEPEGTINGNLIIDSTLTYFSSVAGIGMGLLNIAAGVGTVYLGMKSGS